MYPQYRTPSIGGTYQNQKAETAAQNYGAAASAFLFAVPPRVPTVPFHLILPPQKVVFARRICTRRAARLFLEGPPGFSWKDCLFCRKGVLWPGKSTGRLLRPFIPLFLTDFTMFFAKKALQMNFKNILYNYRFNFFMQIVSYRFVWGSRICAFCTASALR